LDKGNSVFPFTFPGYLKSFALQPTAQAVGNARVVFDYQDVSVRSFGHVWILSDFKKTDLYR
jgi:hypothetical protein